MKSIYWAFRELKNDVCNGKDKVSRAMRFPTMWYVLAKPKISLCLSLECSMSFKLLPVHHLEFVCLKGRP